MRVVFFEKSDQLYGSLTRAYRSLKSGPTLEPLPRARCTLKQINAPHLKKPNETQQQRNPTQPTLT